MTDVGLLTSGTILSFTEDEDKYNPIQTPALSSSSSANNNNNNKNNKNNELINDTKNVFRTLESSLDVWGALPFPSFLKGTPSVPDLPLCFWLTLVSLGPVFTMAAVKPEGIISGSTAMFVMHIVSMGIVPILTILFITKDFEYFRSFFKSQLIRQCFSEIWRTIIFLLFGYFSSVLIHDYILLPSIPPDSPYSAIQVHKKFAQLINFKNPFIIFSGFWFIFINPIMEEIFWRVFLVKEIGHRYFPSKRISDMTAMIPSTPISIPKDHFQHLENTTGAQTADSLQSRILNTEDKEKRQDNATTGDKVNRYALEIDSSQNSNENISFSKKFLQRIEKMFENEQTILISSIARFSIFQQFEKKRNKKINFQSSTFDLPYQLVPDRSPPPSSPSSPSSPDTAQEDEQNRQPVQIMSDSKTTEEIKRNHWELSDHCLAIREMSSLEENKNERDRVEEKEIQYLNRMSKSQQAPSLAYSDVNVSFLGHVIISFLYSSYHGVVMSVNGTSHLGTLSGMSFLISYGLMFSWTRCKLDYGLICAVCFHVGVDAAVIRDMLVDVFYS